MNHIFFPNAAFAWVFCIVLFLLTCVAAYIDTRKAKIPNRITVLILILGLIANIVRGGWLASQNKEVWVCGTGSVALGMFDGLLFAVVGFLVYFAAMFLIWILGACGGGDVKLLAAVAAWLGLEFFFVVWMASIGVLLVWILLKVASGEKVTRKVRPEDGKPDSATTPRKKLRVTYSLPFAIATGLALLYLFRFELLLDERPQPAPQPEGAHAHVRPAPDLA